MGSFSESCITFKVGFLIRRLELSDVSCNNKRGQWDRKEVIFRDYN